ncbi:hypothetical protein PV327_010364 [Microctonus hyperodae]|uniref:Uncharacterized protein n=1 Tax=Microctonus hyperodae TaxID=165561 RepID=A0AA39FS41_MICHY|nr:hypothetical protein PV327_010364 [Microctonus hyperodae]
MARVAFARPRDGVDTEGGLYSLLLCNDSVNNIVSYFADILLHRRDINVMKIGFDNQWHSRRRRRRRPFENSFKIIQLSN